jgi:iron(II)-dependent oxidoreductase
MRRQAVTKHGLFTLIIVGILLLTSIGCGEAQKTQTAELPKEIIGKRGVEMILIPDGQFTMGSPKGEGYDNEHPQHTVVLDAFYIDKYEVTNVQYKKFMDATGHEAPEFWSDEKYNRPNQPVVGVTWHDAAAYAKWAGKRLPTEAEWEKAARGTGGRRYPWGSQWNSLKCNFGSESDGYKYTAPVGSFLTGRSPYGAMDMAGNVWEWCADWYDENYYGPSPEQDSDAKNSASTIPPSPLSPPSPQENPEGPDSGSMRVLRGGSWADPPRWSLRCAHRHRDYPSSRSSVRGFRCVADTEADVKPDVKL